MRWAATAILAGLALAAASPGLAANPSFHPADAARGKTLATVCLTCHGVEGKQADVPPFHIPKLAGQRAEVIFQALRDYKSGMRMSDVMGPMATPLTEQDMRDVAEYLSSGGPVKPPQTAGETSWAHDKVRADCTACHGESGMGVMPSIPVLTGQYEDYLLHALNAYRGGTRKNPTMAPIAAKLAPKEVALLAAYFAAQKNLGTPK
jgi:cytochrome c553